MTVLPQLAFMAVVSLLTMPRTHPRRRLWRRDGRDAGELTIRSGREGDRHVVAPLGELDLANAWELEQELRRAEASDAQEILIDLRGLQFIDSVGMRPLIDAGSRSRHHSKRLMILQGPPNIERVFEVSGLIALLPFVAPAALAEAGERA